ncbi:frataxin-like protein [Pseudomonas sp. BAY1663]|uniref:iron donor protein CyaY n=1 Tax=Pseudomonas sp. BAY1663 TaxID=1439940 RepID=UPI00042E07C6|nr:iron donor protein CyaY [Pseudomonas sp. BAY1663]EXF44177.1 frataxin-like protein [Pseudomonas sp. BAY1663]
MSLSEARYHDLVDTVQESVEDAFDDSGLDVDLENSGGVLTVRFDNGSQLILSRQPALRQLWVAARSGGFHFDYDEGNRLWLCDASGERLGELLARATQEQAGEALTFDEL